MVKLMDLAENEKKRFKGSQSNAFLLPWWTIMSGKTAPTKKSLPVKKPRVLEKELTYASPPRRARMKEKKEIGP